MRTLLLVAALALAAAPALAQPEVESGGSFLGLFADEAGTLCYMEIPGTPSMFTFYIIASCNPDYIVSLTGAEFAVSPWIVGQTGILFANIAWAPDILTIGDITTDLSVAAQTPIDGPIVVLGTVTGMAATAGMPGANFTMEVIPGDLQADGYILLADETSTEYRVGGNIFTLNCGGDCPDCTPTTPTAEVSWSSIKALY